MLLTFLVLVAGCGGGEESVGSAADSAASAVESAASAAESAVSDAASAGQSAASSIKKVSANDASLPELQAALLAAGVDDPERWAKEVQAYRPYPADDPSFAKLRGELEKSNPGPGVVDKIVSALEL
jgi:hypothetical protein